MSRMLNACFEYLEAGIDLLFPPRCVSCGERGEHWCRVCQEQVMVIGGQLCPRCGVPVGKAPICKYCQSLGSIDALRSYAWYRGSIIPPILALKYRPNNAIANRLGQLMAEVLHGSGWQLDLVLGVPLGQARFRQRGYNQAGLLAAALASELSLRCESQALIRRRETASQVGLDRRGRMDNVSLAFRALPEYAHGRKILVVDDLVTSGATLSACAEALIQAGAKAVYGVSVARACRTV